MREELVEAEKKELKRIAAAQAAARQVVNLCILLYFQKDTERRAYHVCYVKGEQAVLKEHDTKAFSTRLSE